MTAATGLPDAEPRLGGAGLWWLGLLVVLAAVLRFAFVGVPLPHFDEAFSMSYIRTGLDALFSVSRATDIHPPLYHGLLAIWTDIFGEGRLEARSLSALFSVLTVPVFYLIAWRRFGLRVAAVATLYPAPRPVWFQDDGVELRSAPLPPAAGAFADGAALRGAGACAHPDRWCGARGG